MANRSFPDFSSGIAEGSTANGGSAPNGREDARSLDAHALPLAHRPAIRLGAAIIIPSRRTIEGPGGATLAEPRVLQVLLALADARGGVLSRDDLRRICWRRQIVGDDSLNRAIAEVRRIARAVDAGFGVETIPRIGYRLTLDQGADAAEPPEAAATAAVAGEPEDFATSPDQSTAERAAIVRQATGWSRRAAISGGALALAAGGWALLRPRDNPRVAALIASAEQALRDELPDSDAQGVGFLREATTLAPDNARAWGLLAMAERNAAENGSAQQTHVAVAACQTAARAALALDPRQPDALSALAMLQPVYGDWLAAEDRLRAVLRIAPRHVVTLGALGILMQSVGRNQESFRWASEAARLDPLSPVQQYRLAYKYWIAGDTARADQVADRAMQLWPLHPAVWMARFLIFAFTGRPGGARAMLEDARQRATLPSPMIALWRLTLDALAAPTPAAIRQASAAHRAAATRSPIFAILGIQVLSAMGDVEGALSAATGYLLRRGPLLGALRTGADGLAVNDQRWRKTIMLFTPPSAALRADPRFAGLCRDIGLADYWRMRRVSPDYLQGR